MRCTGWWSSPGGLFLLLPGCAGRCRFGRIDFSWSCHGLRSFPRFATQVYPKPWQKAITKTTKEPRTKQAIPPTETAAQYKERSPPWPFDLNYQRGLLSLFSLCSEVRITPHHENGLLHLHLVWCSILSSETAETLAAARVSWVTPFSATLVVRWLQFGYFPF